MHRKISLLTAAIIFSLSMPVTTYAADAEQVSAMIEQLPAEEEDVTERNAEDIARAMEEYESLTAAEKIKVKDYERLEKLYEEADARGFIEHKVTTEQQDQMHAEEEQSQLEISDSVEAGETEYVFSITDDYPSLSVVIHYITDLNGDGAGDMPSRIVLTSPSGITVPISNSNTALEDETMDIALTWESGFVQLDVASAETGKWKITSSDPVTFKTIPYAGVQKPLKAEEEKEKEDADTEVQEEEESSFGFGRLIIPLLLIGVLIYLLKAYIFKKSENEKDRKPVEKKQTIEEDIPRRMTDKEVEEQMRREFMERKSREAEEYDEEDEYDDLEEEVTEKVDYDDIELDEHMEGDTDYLKKSENPVLSGGGYRDNISDENTDDAVDNSFDFLDDNAF